MFLLFNFMIKTLFFKLLILTIELHTVVQTLDRIRALDKAIHFSPKCDRVTKKHVLNYFKPLKGNLVQTYSEPIKTIKTGSSGIKMEVKTKLQCLYKQCLNKGTQWDKMKVKLRLGYSGGKNKSYKYLIITLELCRKVIYYPCNIQRFCKPENLKFIFLLIFNIFCVFFTR